MARWGYAHEEETLCDCGEPQTMGNILKCGRTGCTDEDLALVNETAIAAIGRWKKFNLIQFNSIKKLYINLDLRRHERTNNVQVQRA